MLLVKSKMGELMAPMGFIINLKNILTNFGIN